MPKKQLHPKWYQAEVICEGIVVLTLGSTKPILHVDVWAGNHPFYTGSQKIIDTQGRIENYERKYKKSYANILYNNS